MNYIKTVLGFVLLLCVNTVSGIDIGIAVLLEFEDTNHGSSVVQAARIAVDDLNADAVLSRNGQNRLVLVSRIVAKEYPNIRRLKEEAPFGPDTFDSEHVANDFYVYSSLLKILTESPQGAVIGPYFSAVAMDLRVQCDYFRLPLITPSAPDPFLTIGAEYLYQPIVSDDHLSEFFQKLMEKSLWTRVAVIYTENADGVNGVQHFLARCLQNGVSLLGSYSIAPDEPDNTLAALNRFKASGATVFFVAAPYEHAYSVLGSARSIGLLSPTYVWMVQGIQDKEANQLDGLFEGVILAAPAYKAENEAFETFETKMEDAGFSTIVATAIATSGIVTEVGTVLLQAAASGEMRTRGLQINPNFPLDNPINQWSEGIIINKLLSEAPFNMSIHESGGIRARRLENWMVEGKQVYWDQTTHGLKYRSLGFLSGKGHNWATENDRVDPQQLSWFLRNGTLPSDRPPLSSLTVTIAVSLRSYPFCHAAVGGSLAGQYSGFACDIIALLQMQLGFDVNLIVGNYSDDDLLSMVDRGADILVGHIPLHPTVAGNTAGSVAYTHPYWTDGIIAVGRVSDAKSKTDLWHFVSPFAGDMWALWFCWIIFAGLVFFGFEYRVNEELSSLSIPEALLQSMWFSFTASLACQDMVPKTWAGKISGWAMLFIALLIVSAYTANLAAFLVISPNPSGPTVDNIGTTISGSTVGAEIGSVALDLVQAMKGALGYQVFETAEELAENVANSSLKMMVEENPIALYLTSSWGVTRGCPLQTFGSQLGQVSYAFGVSQNWGYAAELSHALVTVRSGQDVSKTDIKAMFMKYFSSGSCSTKGASVIDGTPKIKAADMGGAFICYAIAVSIAALIYIYEIKTSKKTPVTIQVKPDEADSAVEQGKLADMLSHMDGRFEELEKKLGLQESKKNNNKVFN